MDVRSRRFLPLPPPRPLQVASSVRAAERVTGRVAGLYEAVGFPPPAPWSGVRGTVERLSRAGGILRSVTLHPSHPEGSGAGTFAAGYDPPSGTLHVRTAFRGGLPRFVAHPNALTPEGTPTGMYFLLAVAKVLAAERREDAGLPPVANPSLPLRRVVLHKVEDDETGRQLQALMRAHGLTHPRALNRLPVSDLLANATMQRAVPTLAQLGYDVTSVALVPHGRRGGSDEALVVSFDLQLTATPGIGR